MFNSMITFLYYQDLEYGDYFMKNILQLTEVMDQGFAKIYQVNEKAFLGIVSKDQRDNITEDTLISLSTNDVEKSYQQFTKQKVINLSSIKEFPQIPLRSFFFEDNEGHHFEIQEFLNTTHKNQF